MGLIRDVLHVAGDKVAQTIDSAVTPAAAAHPTHPETAAPAFVEVPLSTEPPHRHAHRHRHGEQYDEGKPAGVNGVAGGITNKPKKGVLGKLDLVLAMGTSAEQREIHAMKSVARWGLSLVLVGIVFVALTASGTFPDSVSNLKFIGVYTEYMVKYSLYILAGILGFVATIMAKRALDAGSSTVLWQGVLLVAMLLALATIGMSIWLDVEVNNFSASPWWSWLILVLIIIQRGVFSLACFFGILTLRAYEVNSKESTPVNKGTATDANV